MCVRLVWRPTAMRRPRFRGHDMYQEQQWSLLRLYMLPAVYLWWRQLLLCRALQHCFVLVQVNWRSREDFRNVQMDRGNSVSMTAGGLSVCMNVCAHGVSITVCLFLI